MEIQRKMANERRRAEDVHMFGARGHRAHGGGGDEKRRETHILYVSGHYSWWDELLQLRGGFGDERDVQCLSHNGFRFKNRQSTTRGERTAFLSAGEGDGSLSKAENTPYIYLFG